jgi:hypothetical protein
VQDLLAYMRRITSGKSTEPVEGEWWWPAHQFLVEALGGQVARVPQMGDACQQAVELLFAVADYGQVQAHGHSHRLAGIGGA